MIDSSVLAELGIERDDLSTGEDFVRGTLSVNAGQFSYTVTSFRDSNVIRVLADWNVTTVGFKPNGQRHGEFNYSYEENGGIFRMQTGKVSYITTADSGLITVLNSEPTNELVIRFLKDVPSENYADHHINPGSLLYCRDADRKMDGTPATV